MPSGRQFKELSTDAKIISIPILFASYPNRSGRYLAAFNKADFEETGFES